MAVSCTYAATATVVETLAGNPSSAPDATRTVTHSAFNIAVSLNAASAPPVTQVAEFVLALTAGAATIDLRNLAGTNAAIVDLNGLKPQIIRIKNTGANKMTFSAGASNPHNAFTDDGTDVQPGGHIVIFTNDNSDDVSGTTKTWDVAGTGTQQAQVTIIAG